MGWETLSDYRWTSNDLVLYITKQMDRDYYDVMLRYTESKNAIRVAIGINMDDANEKSKEFRDEYESAEDLPWEQF